MAEIVTRHGHVADLCHHAKICSNLRQATNTVDETADELEFKCTNVKLSGPRARKALACGRTLFAFENRGVQRLMERKIRDNGSGMVFPITVGDTMRIPMQNRSVPMGANTRVQVRTPPCPPLPATCSLRLVLSYPLLLLDHPSSPSGSDPAR
jgi:hypothetical protein